MQEFFHIFTVNFFLFVTTLRILHFLSSIALCREARQTSPFHVLFRRFSFPFPRAGGGGQPCLPRPLSSCAYYDGAVLFFVPRPRKIFCFFEQMLFHLKDNVFLCRSRAPSRCRSEPDFAIYLSGNRFRVIDRRLKNMYYSYVESGAKHAPAVGKEGPI
jgi:hypothetical protein